MLPESPRWLLAEGRHSEATRELQRAARMNKKTLPASWLATAAESHALVNVSTRHVTTVLKSKAYSPNLPVCNAIIL